VARKSNLRWHFLVCWDLKVGVFPVYVYVHLVSKADTGLGCKVSKRQAVTASACGQAAFLRAALHALARWLGPSEQQQQQQQQQRQQQYMQVQM